MIDLSPAHLAEVRKILDALVPGLEVRAFGSRVDGTAGPFSDLDLALVAADPVDWRRLETLKDAFSASDLPFSVDVVDWATLSPAFRERIETRCERIG